MDDYDKMSAIFIAFDRNRDGVLDKRELTQLINRCNPSVDLTSLQLDAIIHEVRLRVVHCNLVEPCVHNKTTMFRSCWSTKAVPKL